MDLSKYNQMPHFDATKEPQGNIKKSKGELVFVVQKHAASHLHYDFRLEIGGVLKSWAIPKGPSMNPEKKRLAILVEDHPYDYKDFEGTIPEGNYGAGTVIVWDQGTYTSVNNDEDNVETKLESDFTKGHLSIILKGKKLKGEFELLKFKTENESSWLLIKQKDQYATEDDILKSTKSVISNLTLEEMAQQVNEKIKR
jgi:bifunctional non-homologous end joining protein LigD